MLPLSAKLSQMNNHSMSLPTVGTLYKFPHKFKVSVSPTLNMKFIMWQTGWTHLCGRARRFNIANTTACHYARSSASSVHLPFLRSVCPFYRLLSVSEPQLIIYYTKVFEPKKSLFVWPEPINSEMMTTIRRVGVT